MRHALKMRTSCSDYTYSSGIPVHHGTNDSTASNALSRKNYIDSDVFGKSQSGTSLPLVVPPL